MLPVASQPQLQTAVDPRDVITPEPLSPHCASRVNLRAVDVEASDVTVVGDGQVRPRVGSVGLDVGERADGVRLVRAQTEAESGSLVVGLRRFVLSLFTRDAERPVQALHDFVLSQNSRKDC